MRVLQTVAEMRAACAEARKQHGPDATLGLVPTMGALHAGHLSLIHAAKQQCDAVAVSIFVNPTQFSPNEDFDKYPRTFEADRVLLEAEEVDLLFAPTAQEMYPFGANTSLVDVPEIGSRLDGQTRPGHFRGVATIVTKLFHIVQPDIAFFGQKDAAQVAVLRAMTRDLFFPLKLEVCPTVREHDGLALSSRNRYLSAEERQQALALSKSLQDIEAAVINGVRNASTMQQQLERELTNAPGLRLDYAAIVHPDTLLPITDITSGALIAVAAYAGRTRLIDNVVLPTTKQGAAS